MAKAKAGRKNENAFAYEQRALVLPRPKDSLLAVCMALTLQAKNLRNTMHFAVNNVLTAYEWDADVKVSRLKSELHTNQRLALDRFNVAIAAINANRENNYKKDKADYDANPLDEDGKEKKPPTLKELALFGEVVAKLDYAALDLTLLDNVMREWPAGNQEGESAHKSGDVLPSVYSRLPAKAAQHVIKRYIESWKGYRESKKTFYKGGAAAAAMTGRPNPPGYLVKKDRYVVEIPLTQGGPLLINLGKKRCIPVDFEESVSLSADEMAAWNECNIEAAIAEACEKRKVPAGAAQHLRIVPEGWRVKMEVVVRLPSKVPENSLLAQLRKALPSTMKSQAEINKTYLAAVADLDLPAAGIDFGLKNTVAMAYTTGCRADVVSAGRLDHVLTELDISLDKLVSSKVTDEVKALQREKEELALLGERLSRAKERELRQGLTVAFADPDYRRLRAQRDRWLNDYFHKLSCGIVKRLKDHRIQILVLGQNKGWKNGMNMGAKQNRRFGRMPLARLIEMIRYKAESLGIVVVTTEESYTSQSSFVNIAPLQVKTGKRKKKLNGEELSILTAKQPQPAPVADTFQERAHPDARGKRSKEDRNRFSNDNQTGRWKVVHADVNAAMNMLRK